MKTITLSANSFHDLNSFYEHLYSLMVVYEDWYPAHNLDALNDMLYHGFGSEPVLLVWKDSKKSSKDLGAEATIAFYQHKIDIGKPYNVKWATEKRDDLAAGKGQTLFDIIVELFNEHPKIILELE